MLGVAAWSARSVALVGFGRDSLIEIGASTVVVWHLSGSRDEARQRQALRLIGVAFAGLAAYLFVQSTVVLAIGHHPHHSPLGIAWTAATAAAMFALAAGKARTGQALANPVLRTEGRVTLIDGLLAVAVLLGLALNAGPGWWWGGPGGRVRSGLLRRARSAGDLLRRLGRSSLIALCGSCRRAMLQRVALCLQRSLLQLQRKLHSVCREGAFDQSVSHEVGAMSRGSTSS